MTASDHPTQIGTYRIVRVLGEGGMGVVYLAEQAEPLRRLVALKVIKLGMDTRDVVARFEAERQALALMDHPHIASVYDAGATADGRPYFAMEYVAGVPITDYCDDARLATRARVTLFIDVCEAVQHAHQKGVIHRDLKPSNVLVENVDGRPVPKVIDFGIAKATDQRLAERTMFTQHGLLVGTPEYMSPEQADPAGTDLDTRTDIYALGVVLYELLVGGLPFSPTRLRQASYGELLRIIREEEPIKPSALLTTLGATATEIAVRRKTRLQTLAHELRGDLDWITLKALEKDRERRYETPSALAADLRRSLGHEPVSAGPPSAWYRAGKFVRRHRGAVAAMMTIAATVVAGLITSVFFFFRADAQRAEAVRAAYRASIQLASLSLAELNGPAATRHLENADAGLRNWEWRHLHLAADSTVASFDAHGEFNSFPTDAATFSFSPDGATIFWNTNSTIHSWDAATLRPIETLGDFADEIVRVSPAGRYVLVEHPDAGRSQKVLDVRTRAVVLELSAPTTAAAFCPDNSCLVAGFASGELRLLGLPSGNLLATTTTGKGARAIAISANGEVVAAAADASVLVATRNLHRMVTVEVSTGVLALSKDGARIAAAEGAEIKLWSIGRPEQAAVLKGHEGRVLALGFSSDGSQLASSGYDATVRLWDTGQSEPPRVYPFTWGPFAISVGFDPARARLLAGGESQWGGRVLVWDATTSPGKRTFRRNGDSALGGFVGDSRRLVVGDANGVSVINATTGKSEFVLPAGERVDVLAVDARGTFVGGVVGKNRIRLWNLETRRQERELSGHTDQVNTVRFGPGGVLASASSDRTVRVWEAASGRELAKVSLPEVANDVAFAGDDLVFIGSGSSDSTLETRLSLHRWRWRTSEPPRGVDARKGGSVYSLDVSPDGRSVATSGNNETVVDVWDSNLTRRLFATGAVRAPVERVRFTPDGQRIVGAPWDGTLRWWDAQSGEELLSLQHGTVRTGISFVISPNGGLVAGADDRVLTIWGSRDPDDLAAREIIRQLREEIRPHADVTASIERDPSLSTSLRTAVLEAWARQSEDPWRLARKAQGLALPPNQQRAIYESAQKLAEAAVTAAPWNRDATTALALARFRLGRFQECLALLGEVKPASNIRTLLRSMALFRAGRADDGIAVFSIVDGLPRPDPPDQTFLRFLEEARSLVLHGRR